MRVRGPKRVANWSSTARLRAAALRAPHTRALRPPMNPNSTPGRPSGGLLSNVVVLGPTSVTAWPESPDERQNGVW